MTDRIKKVGTKNVRWLQVPDFMLICQMWTIGDGARKKLPVTGATINLGFKRNLCRACILIAEISRYGRCTASIFFFF